MKRWGFLLFLGLLVSLLTFFSAGCKKKDAHFEMYYDYFPQTEGKYVVYQVKEIHTDLQINQKDTALYFLKTVIGDTLLDNSGRIVREFLRYTGSTPTGPWQLKDVWTTGIHQGKGELVEENNRVIKLVFAPSEDDEWDMNAFNTLGEMTCYYTNIHQSYQLGSLHFEETVQVEQENQKNYIEDKRKFEVYARGVGLVYKYFKDNSILGGNPQNIKKGKEIEFRAVAFG